MRARRLRATYLLRSVIFAACVGVFLLVLQLTAWIGLTVAAFLFLLIAWVVGIEMSVLPWLIERMVTKRMGPQDEPVNSIWFIDVRAERIKGIDRLTNASKDNPTIR